MKKNSDGENMDCRDFKEILDSYFCQELAVETNHAILCHAEHCPPCRNEMASRRNLREVLQRACAQDQMSDEACERLRAMLRAEAGIQQFAKVKSRWGRPWAKFFDLKFAIPAMAGAVVLAVIGVAVYLRSPAGQFIPFDPANVASADQVAALRLSETLMADAASSHRKCTSYLSLNSRSEGMSDEVKEFDAACLGLDKVAAEGAQGLPLSSAHVCGDSDRRFAHLIYNRGGQLISLLVTLRDGRAMQAGQVPPFDTALADLQKSQQTGLALDAYQTARHVVLIVSALPKSENEILARTLAMPVVTHLRRVEGQTAFLNWSEFELIANVRGGELR